MLGNYTLEYVVQDKYPRRVDIAFPNKTEI